MPDPDHVLVAGASRGVGAEVVARLRHLGIAVTVLLRTVEDRPRMERLGVTVVIGDALRGADVARAMRSDRPIDAVISTIGGVSPAGERADFAGNRTLVDEYAAVVAAGGHPPASDTRFVLVSSIGVGSSAAALPAAIVERLREALIEKERAEAHLVRSGLAYTIIRPGGLRSEPATGRGVLTEDPRISGTIHRADVARLAVECLTSDRARNVILSAVDRDLVRDGRPFEQFSLS